MKHKPAPLIKRVKELYDFDQNSGVFTRKIAGGKFHRATCGPVTSTNGDGYILISIDGIRYLAHRVAWYYHYGEWPGEIDHWDGNPSNNAISNLRNAGRANNNLNSAGWASNKRRNKLPRGVYKYKACLRKFRSQIVVNRKIIHLGCFDTAEQAENAYKMAAEKHFGEYAYHKRR